MEINKLRENDRYTAYRFEGNELHDNWQQFKNSRKAKKQLKERIKNLLRNERKVQLNWIKKARLNYIHFNEFKDGSYTIHYGFELGNFSMNCREEYSTDSQHLYFYSPFGRFIQHKQGKANPLLNWYQETLHHFFLTQQEKIKDQNESNANTSANRKGAIIIPFPKPKTT